MKKFLLTLLIGCTVGAFSACSDGDDPKPTNPITEYTVPPTAEIGGYYTVTGKGFSATAQLYFRNASGAETAAENQVATATGFECTIPSTLTAGVYTVIVKQDGSWELGSVRLEVAQMPILSLELPEAIKLNKTLEIAGIGFTAASKIYLETTDAAKTRTELTSAISSKGVNCTIPNGVQAGTYNVILKHNNIDWTLGENIPAAVYKQLKEFKYIISQTCDFSPVGGVEAVKALLLQMAGGSQTDADTLFDMLFSEGATVIKQLTFAYNNNGQVTVVQRNVKENLADWYTFTFDGNKVSAENKQLGAKETGIRNFSWMLNDGRVESSNVNFMRTVDGSIVSKPADFTWTYDATRGQCTGVLYQINGGEYVAFKFENGNYTTNGEFEYRDAGKKNNIFGVDVAKAMQSVSSGIDDDHALACFLRFDGKASVNLPTSTFLGSLSEDDPAKAITYTLDDAGYATAAKWGLEGIDMLEIGVKIISETKFEFIYTE